MNAPNEMIPLNVSVLHPSAATLSRGAASALELVNDFAIVDDATFEIGADELKAIKAKASALDEQRKAITKPMDDAKKAVMDLFRAPIDALTKAEGILKGKMLGYQQEVERRANEARLEAERAAKAERERLERQAAELTAQGRTGEAAVKEQVAQMVVAAPVAVPRAPVVAGISTRETIDFEVTDLHALIKHVAERPELVNLLAADKVKLGAYVRGLGVQSNLPGVRVFPKQSIAASRK